MGNIKWKCCFNFKEVMENKGESFEIKVFLILPETRLANQNRGHLQIDALNS